MFRRGLVDTERIGTSTLPNRAIHRGVMKPFSTCIASRIEAWAGSPDPDYRGMRGMVHVQPAAEPHPFSFALLEGAESVGLQRFPNANGRMMEAAGGCAFVDETVRDGKRQSIFRSYVYPLMGQPNITVLTGALATRILFQRRRATGVEFHYQGKTLRAEATREVILSLGAIHTPKLLMQSGIGDEAELKRVDIPVLQALPGVGRNLHDHRCIWVYLGKYGQSAAQRAEKSDRMLLEDRPLRWRLPTFAPMRIKDPIVTRENAVRFKPPAASWSLAVGMRPKSRGAIHLTGSDPADPVRIDANYLGDPQDLKDLIAGLSIAREIGNSAALRPFTGREIAPGALNGDGAGALFSRRAWHLLASVWHRKNGPRCHVGGRWQIEGLRCG